MKDHKTKTACPQGARSLVVEDIRTVSVLCFDVCHCDDSQSQATFYPITQPSRFRQKDGEAGICRVGRDVLF